MSHSFTGAARMAASAAAVGMHFLLAILTVLAVGTAAAADTSRVIVAFKPGAAAQARAAVLAARADIKLDLSALNAIAIEVPSVALRGLRNSPYIEYVEEDRKRYPLALSTPSRYPYMSGQQVPYGIGMVQADRLPDTNTGKRMLCIIDSGIDRKHEDLAGVPASGAFNSGTGWWYTDENQHGTHVAGTVAAINNNGVGVVGVAPNRRLKLHIVKVFGADGWAYSSTLAAAAQQCGTAGANVISMSLGGAWPNHTEMRAFDRLAANGVLSIAAAGNDGNSALTYPAGYASVLMVGAVDQYRAWAPFSQFNSKVELAAPGVAVLSTVPMGSASASALTVGSRVYAPGAMEGSPRSSASAALADFGLGDRVDPAMAGKVCLVARGAIDFAVKVLNCQNSGGVGAVVYNNTAGGFAGTLGASVTGIPSVTASDTEGAALRSQLGQRAALSVKASNYAYYDGTSMATPHVSAVAALVWSYYPSCTAAQVRNTLTRSALDLGPTGRDVQFGYGLVQAKAAYERIKNYGCGN